MLQVNIAIPARKELSSLPACIDSIRHQDDTAIKVWVCVNHPEEWRGIPGHRETVKNNEDTLDYLRSLAPSLPFQMEIIDKVSPGNGLGSRQSGVGMARKVLFDAILSSAEDQEIIVSLDADTQIPSQYISSVRKLFRDYPNLRGLASPYRHPLSGDETTDRAMLRYEIYMRSYLINLLRTNNPYAFTALGSSLAFSAGAIRKAGGFSPKNSGEDFYLLQKLRKSGALAIYLPAIVEPGTRYSSRVGFGTGPAMIKGATGDWSSYPIYPVGHFDKVAAVFHSFTQMPDKEMVSPADDFYSEMLGISNPWIILRRNHPRADRFVKACAERFDGLRILQFLHYIDKGQEKNEGRNLCQLFAILGITEIPWLCEITDLWEEAGLDRLSELRDVLFDIEMKLRKQSPVLDGIF